MMTQRPPKQALFALLFALLAASSPSRAEQPGIMFSESGVHFFLPFGFEVSSTAVRGWDGPVQLVLFEPQDGVVAGQPSSAFVALQVHDYEIAPDAAITRLVSELNLTFGGSEEMAVDEVEARLAGADRTAVRLSFSAAGVAMEATVTAFRDGDITIVALAQGQPDELAVMTEVFDQILDSVGAGPAPQPPPPETSPDL